MWKHGIFPIKIGSFADCVGGVVVVDVYPVVVVFEQHSKTLLSRRLRDHLCHVIVVDWFSMWLLSLVVGVS